MGRRGGGRGGLRSLCQKVLSHRLTAEGDSNAHWRYSQQNLVSTSRLVFPLVALKAFESYVEIKATKPHSSWGHLLHRTICGRCPIQWHEPPGAW